jgi:hypothetical protein
MPVLHLAKIVMHSASLILRRSYTCVIFDKFVDFRLLPPMSKPDLDLTAADAFAPLGLGSTVLGSPTLKRISQAVLYLASRPIAFTSLPVVDFRVLHRTPNHAKGRILSIYCIANAYFAPRASPSCLFLSSTISHFLPSVLFSYHVVK